MFLFRCCHVCVETAEAESGDLTQADGIDELVEKHGKKTDATPRFPGLVHINTMIIVFFLFPVKWVI